MLEALGDGLAGDCQRYSANIEFGLYERWYFPLVYPRTYRRVYESDRQAGK